MALAVDAIRDGASELDLLRACLGPTAAKLKAEVGETFKLRGSAVVGTVHSGPQAALPHGAPGGRVPQPGDTLIAGIGVSVAGYHAESGATFIIGEPAGDAMRCLETAAACNDAAVAALRPGVSCASVNAAALNVLREAGYSDFIRHRIGHGMGIDGHESPWLAPGDETVVQAGMVFSNEPGIYRPGVDGYRTINSMIVTEDGARVPNRFLQTHPPNQRVLAL
jgi:Xaa-Pro aminopeptidase